MTTNDLTQNDSIDPPAHAATVGVDERGREHRFDRRGDRMFVECDGGWTMGPVTDLERYVSEMDDAIGWDDLRYSSEDPFVELTRRVIDP